MIPEKVKKLLEKGQTFYLATASKLGVPNVVAVESMGIKDNKILIADCHFGKTKANLKENPKASILTTDGKDYFQIKGKTEYKTSGEECEDMKEELADIGLSLVGALIVSCDEIYDLVNYKRII